MNKAAIEQVQQGKASIWNKDYKYPEEKVSEIVTACFPNDVTASGDGLYYFKKNNNIWDCEPTNPTNLTPIPLEEFFKEEEGVKHFLNYDMHSCKVSWCTICNEHFYNERNREHTTIATQEHYHVLPPKQSDKINKSYDIVIDFDGTVVTHDYPLIGSDIGAVPVLKELVENGHRLILFTMRSDKEHCLLDDAEQVKENGAAGLSEAVMWFKDNGIELYGIQTNPSQSKWTTSPKAYGQIIIDDAALGCPLVHFKHKRPYVNWETVRFWLQEMQLIKVSRCGS